MEQKICLIIIYNHRYDCNIEVLEKIYSGKFEAIYHLVPFYDGKRENVIPVYESSYQFQGYVAQAMREFYHETYTHYLFIGDDLLLNPSINQENFFEFFNLDPRYSALAACTPLVHRTWWAYEDRIYNAICSFSKYNGTNYREELPNARKAFKKAFDLGYSKKDFLATKEQLFFGAGSKKSILQFVLRHPKHVLKLLKGIPLPYPVFGGYSDIFILNKDDIETVSRMFGVFAAIRLFVETAIPTAMRLHCKDLQLFGGGVKLKSCGTWQKKRNLNMIIKEV